MNHENRCVHACRKVVGIYNALSFKEKELIPFSLIRAICCCAGLTKPEEQKPVGPEALRHMDGLTAAVMELILFYSGTDSKKEALSNIRENTVPSEREMIRRILQKKKELDHLSNT